MVMKRKIMSIMMMVAMLFSMNITAFAVDRIGAPIAHAMRSSSYLDSYSVGIEARGNGTIAVTAKRRKNTFAARKHCMS